MQIKCIISNKTKRNNKHPELCMRKTLLLKIFHNIINVMQQSYSILQLMQTFISWEMKIQTFLNSEESDKNGIPTERRIPVIISFIGG